MVGIEDGAEGLHQVEKFVAPVVALFVFPKLSQIHRIVIKLSFCCYLKKFISEITLEFFLITYPKIRLLQKL